MLYISGLHTVWPGQDNGPRSLILNAVIDPSQREQTETVKNRYLLLSIALLFCPPFDIRRKKRLSCLICCCRNVPGVQRERFAAVQSWLTPHPAVTFESHTLFQPQPFLVFTAPPPFHSLSCSLPLSAPSGPILRLRFHSSVF